MNQFITPILLGYVNRYIKNFQPNDWQVSLWEGDATFNNLELRPEVLEEDFKVPFSLVSGQIYELLIHVPWTRLTWEPVVVTLNTVECILKLRNGLAPPHQQTKRQDSENHPSYIQSLVSKILNNITVVCNNLSIKYIEEDIVLSMHVRTLTFRTADKNWNAAFSEVTEPALRKKISVSDLTVCLDKRNASGKIEAYHEPVLYRSSLEFRLLMYYRSQPDGKNCDLSDLKANRPADGDWDSEDGDEREFLVIRLDVRATQILDFQLNEEQLPMFFRLCELCRALAKGDLPKSTVSLSEENVMHFGSVSEKNSSVMSSPGPLPFGVEQDNESGISDAAKTGWTDYFSSLFPSAQEMCEVDMPKFEPQIWDFGFYVEKLSLELKVMDRGQEHSFYGPTKVVRPCTSPFAAIVLHGVSAQLLKLGCDKKDDEGAKSMFNLRLGASQVLVEPLGGICPCGTRDGLSDYNEDSLGNSMKDKNQPFFIFAGGDMENYEKDSLFDEKSSENAGTLRPYNCSSVHHLETVTETAMLERTPALALDFLYTVVTPCDWDLESLAKLRDLEYSNFDEESLIRILLGPARVKICASFLHRLQLLMHFASQCDYPPYFSPTSESKFNTVDVQSSSDEDTNDLESSSPADIYRITLFRPFIQFYLNDHPEYKPGVPKIKKKIKKPISTQKFLQFEDMPSVSFQSNYIDAKIVKPMYPLRMAETTKGLEKIPSSLMDTMYNSGTVEVTDVACHVILQGRQTTALFLNGINYVQKNIILPEYWSQKDLTYSEKFLQCESFRVASTKFKLDIIIGIISSFVKSYTIREHMRILSMIPLATADQDFPMADASLEGITIKCMKTQQIEAYHLAVSSVKVLLLKADSHKGDLKQTLILSGPEEGNTKDSEEYSNTYMLKATLQRKIVSITAKPVTKLINPLLAFQINHAHLCVDQLLLDWLSPLPNKLKTSHTLRSGLGSIKKTSSAPPRFWRRAASEEAPTVTVSSSEAANRCRRASTSSSSRTIPPAPPESVHSSSERGVGNSRRFSGNQAAGYGSSSALAEVEENEDFMEDGLEDLELSSSNQTVFEYLLDIFKAWCGATVVGKVKKVTAYIPATTGDGCISSEGTENIPQTVKDGVANGKALGALLIELPCLSLHSAGVQGDVFLQNCFSHFPVKTTFHNLEKNLSVNFPWSLSMSNLVIKTLHPSLSLPLLKPVTTILTVGVTTSALPALFTPGGSLNLCIHVDTSAVIFSISEQQWDILTNIVTRLSVLIPPSAAPPQKQEIQPEPPVFIPQPFLPSPSSAASFQPASSVTASEQSSVKVNRDMLLTGGVKFAALVQWTLARITLSVYASSQSIEKYREQSNSSRPLTRKMSLVLEDLMTSVDVKEVYLKIDSKVASARITHYQRSDSNAEWKPGPYLGLVMRCNEDSPSSVPAVSNSGLGSEANDSTLSKDKLKSHPVKSHMPFPIYSAAMQQIHHLQRKENGNITSGNSATASGGFLVVTFTQAQCQSVHQKWGRLQKRIDSQCAPPYCSNSLATSSLTPNSTTGDKYHPALQSNSHPYSVTQLPEVEPSQQSVPFNAFDSSRYVSELSVRIQPLDVIFSSENLQDFWAIFSRIDIPFSHNTATSKPSTEPNSNLDGLSSTPYSNINLPLLYIDAHNLRLILPSSKLTEKISRLSDDVDKESAAVTGFHDVCILQVDRLNVAPQVENPIERVQIRSDIYNMAEESRILGIPGSVVEDRQYQIQIHNINVNSGMWYELEPCFEKDPMVSYSYVRGENPALEWSKLAKGRSCLAPEVSVLPLVNRFDLCITAAPAVVYRPLSDGHSQPIDVLVCGYAMEIHAASNIDACASTYQVELLSEIVSEFLSLFEKSEIERNTEIATSVSSDIIHSALLSEKEDERVGDSGVDVSSSGCFGTPVTNSSCTIPVLSPNVTEFNISENVEERSDLSIKNMFTVPLELFVTCEKVTLVLYDVTGSSSLEGRGKNATSRRKHYAKRVGVSSNSRHNSMDSRNQRLLRNSSDLGYDGSEEGSVEDGPTGSVSFYVQPLLHFFVIEPHTALSLSHSSKKIQFSVFDTGLRTSGSGYVVQGGGQKLIPRLEDFQVQILETKSGDRHTKTGVPPSFLTITWIDVLSPTGVVKIEIDRPTKLNISVPRWKYIRDVLRRLGDCTKCLQNDQNSLNRASNSFHRKGVSGKSNETLMTATFLSCLKSCSLSLSTVQLVVVVELVGRNGGLRGERQEEATLALSSFYTNLWSTEGFTPWEPKSRALNFEAIPYKLQGNVKMSSVTASIFHHGRSKVMLYPWSFSINGSIMWEPWMNQSDPPRVQINADSETVLIDLGPDHLVFLQAAISEFMSVISPDRQQQYANSEIEKESESKDELYSAEICPDSSMEELMPVKIFKHPIKQPRNIRHTQSATSISYCTHSSGVSDPSSPTKEQHYQDDLRAGAFLFIDGVATQTSMPFPYQVVFKKSPPTMAWCYPEPRTLTKVHVYPVPFVVASESMTGMSSVQHGQQIIDQVVCSLQYWCECRNQFMDYCHFYLSESTYTRLDLPSLTETSRLAVARTWRVQLQLRSNNREDGTIRQQVTMSPRSLAGCMRVDSYFSPALIPSLEASLNLTSFRVTLFNHLTHISKKMPKPLNVFTYDEAMPESQPFSSTSADGVELFLSIKEPHPKSKEHPASLVVNTKGHLRFDVIDSAFLTQQCVVQPFLVEAQVTMTDPGGVEPSTATLNLLCRPITVRFGAASAHTLAMSLQLWSEVLQYTSEDEKAVPNNRYMMLITRYLICNDTMQSIRFGQTDTKECIQLLSRQCHFYSWFTQKKKQVMTFELEKNSHWFSTSSISLDYEGTKLCRWYSDNPGINIFITIESLSTTQKQITVMGQLMVTNLLMEPVDLQIPYESCQLEDNGTEEGKSEKKEVTQALIVPVASKSTPASILPPHLSSSHASYFRVRFQGTDDGLASGSWSGKVPLLPDSDRSFIPYPVKVPLHERNHYYCVWCRVVYQKIDNVRRILVVLSPLFAVRSFLPVSAEVEVSTPELRVMMHAIAKGRGTDQELYCPGTTATSHVLTFNLEDQHRFEVPLSYQMLQKTQQELEEVENSKKIVKAPNIDDVLKQLKESFSEPEPRWPYVGEEFNGVDWVAGPLSQTDIEVSYVNPGPHCSTLLVQVRPKVLLANILGVEIYLTSEVEEVLNEEDEVETIRRVSMFRTRQALCSVPHHGVIAAPKLEGIFHLGIRLMENEDVTDDDEKTGEEESGEMFFSPPLQLSTAEWAGNKPHISGVVPLEGSARTRIFCGKYVCFLVITSVMTPYGVRVLTVRPMYTVCNHTLERLRLSALCVVDLENGQNRKRRMVPNSPLLLDIPPGEGEDSGSRGVKDGKSGHMLGWPVILWSLIQPDGHKSKHEGYARCIGEQKLEPYIQFGMDGPVGELLSGCPMKIGMSPENPGIGISQSAQPRRMCFTVPVSSPVEKDEKIMRLIKNRGKDHIGHELQVTNRPFVMTMHEKEGQSFLLVHDDPCPQMEVRNLCNFDILVGESEKNISWAGPSDAEHFHWLTVVQSGTSAFYSLPSRSLSFPDICSCSELSSLVLAGGDLGLDEEPSPDMWSECVRVDDTRLRDPEGQFLRLFPGRDVRVRVEERHNNSYCRWGGGCSTSVTIEPAPRASVLAKDVRERLGATYEPSNPSIISLSNVATVIQTNPSNVSYYSTTSSTLDIPDRSLNSSTSKLVAVDSSSVMYYDAYECRNFSFFPSSLSFLLSSYNYASEMINEESMAVKPPWQLNCTCLIGGVRFSLVDDLHPPWERTEVILLSLDDICLAAEPTEPIDVNLLQVVVSVGDCQLDNQQHVNYDFPVILLRDGTTYSPCVVNSITLFSLLSKSKSLVDEARKDALLIVTAGVKIGDCFHPSSLLQTIEVNMKPIRVYLEDRFDLYLMDTCLSLLPSSLLFPHLPQSSSPQFNEPRDLIPPDQFPPPSPWSPGHVFLPHGPFLESIAVAKPLRLKMLSLGPASLLVSLHTYAGVYIAANHSPLQFSAFERTHLFTSSYELGRALTLHYRSGVLLCAGWVLGSLELLGSPGGLACTVGRGIHDFLRLPLAGILQGPWGFVLGVIHGSASLMKHITAGTVNSVTMLASSVARNLDQLTLDEEHMRWTEEVRRRPPKGVAQGLLRGLTGLGISLLGAVGGIVYHPMQSMVNEGSQSLVSGVGKGLVGVITKPLSGAAELVALTGQGLLHGTGWANLPLPKQPTLMESVNEANDSQLKYIWKILPLSLTSCPFIPPSTFSVAPGLAVSHASLSGFKCLMIVEAMSVSSSGTYTPVTLILTAEGLLIVELDIRKETSSNYSTGFFWVSLKEVSGMEPSPSDPTLLRLQLTHMIEPVIGTEAPVVSPRSRILEYVRNTTVLVCPVQVSGSLGPSAMNDCTAVPPAPDQVSVPSIGPNISQDSSHSQSLPQAPCSTSPNASISSHSSFPSLVEKSGSCSAEPSDQPMANFDDSSCKLYHMMVQPGLPLNFHLAPAAGVHFLSLLKLVKRQSLGKGYPVL